MMRVLSFVVVCVLLAPSFASGQIGTAFIYQGRLTDGGAPATGSFDFQMVLYDAPVGGAQQGSIVTVDDVAVGNGTFTATLDFGDVFDGGPRFLEIGVRPGASSGIYSLLSPRQPLTPTPHALFSAAAATATTVAGLVCADNQVAKWNGTGWTCGPDVDTDTTYVAGAGLALAGNAFGVDGTIVARKDAAAGNQAFDTNTLFLDYTNNRVGIGTSTPTVALDVAGPFKVDGGTAAADTPDAAPVTFTAQHGGADGGDANDVGGNGGSIHMIPGTPGPARSAGAFIVLPVRGGAATASSGGGEGSDLRINTGSGGDSAGVQAAGPGGDMQIRAGGGGTNTGGGVGGAGGPVTLASGPGGTNSGGGLGGSGGTMTLASGSGGSGGGSAGYLEILAGNGIGTGAGGDIHLRAGSSGSGPGGEVTIIPGGSPSGTRGSIQLGLPTSQANTTTQGAIKVHVVDGDLNFATPGDGIILRSPDGEECRFLSISNAGGFSVTEVPCP